MGYIQKGHQHYPPTGPARMAARNRRNSEAAKRAARVSVGKADPNLASYQNAFGVSVDPPRQWVRDNWKDLNDDRKAEWQHLKDKGFWERLLS